MRRLPLLLAVFALPVAAGCGGGSGGPDGSGGGRYTGNAAEVFSTACGSCHTLKAAGTEGSFGPNLDDKKYNAGGVLGAIADGPGSMPSGIVQGEQAQAVADYVAKNAGS